MVRKGKRVREGGNERATGGSQTQTETDIQTVRQSDFQGKFSSELEHI